MSSVKTDKAYAKRMADPTRKRCKVDGCNQPYETRLMCSFHYTRFRFGRPIDAPRRRGKEELSDPCKIEGCDRPWKTRQMCEFHYGRWFLRKDVEGPMRRLSKDEIPDVCSLDGCDKPHFSRGWCKPHWGRVHKYGEPGPVEIRGWGGDRSCTVDGCDRPYLARGCCSRHYYRLPDRKLKSAIKTSGRRWRKRNQAPMWPVDAEKVQARIDYFGGRCWICGGPDADQVDHVKPIARGGLHTPANMRPAHAACNLSKGSTWEGVEASG